MIEKYEVMITPLDEERLIHIYLPDDYMTSKKRYPVMYMYDGHNLFLDEDATYGTSWGLKDYFDEHQSDIIVVGIECNHEGNYRLWEFSPYDFHDDDWGDVTGYGKELMTWVVEELKPMIDDAFPTLSDRMHTGIGGSSMGGLMALYTIFAHNDVFSKAACLSPFFNHVFDDLRVDLQTPLDAKTSIYISYGSEEFQYKDELSLTTSALFEIANLCNRQQVSLYLNLVLGAIHAEACWKKETDVWYPFLWEGAK